MNVEAVRVSPTSKMFYVRGFGIQGSRKDLRRWASLCKHTITFVETA